MLSAIVPTSISIPRPSVSLHTHLSSTHSLLSSSTQLSQFSIPTHATTTFNNNYFPSLTIRMGGGPRTFPGGVSKWQWKRMQAKKAKQLLKARLCRERQIYEMRKRAELKAAISELERPWEVVQRAPNLFSIKADEQVKVLADRFHRPGGFDMWSEEDGPSIFKSRDGVPSARFFPKGAVHSLKPYGVVGGEEGESGGERQGIGRSSGGRRGIGSENKQMRNRSLTSSTSSSSGIVSGRKMRDLLDSWDGEKDEDEEFNGSHGNGGGINGRSASSQHVSRSPPQWQNGGKAESFDPRSLRSKADRSSKARNSRSIDATCDRNGNFGEVNGSGYSDSEDEGLEFDGKVEIDRSVGRTDSRNQRTMQQRNRSRPSNSFRRRNHSPGQNFREKVAEGASEDEDPYTSRRSNSWRFSNHDGRERRMMPETNALEVLDEKFGDTEFFSSAPRSHSDRRRHSSEFQRVLDSDEEREVQERKFSNGHGKDLGNFNRVLQDSVVRFPSSAMNSSWEEDDLKAI